MVHRLRAAGWRNGDFENAYQIILEDHLMTIRCRCTASNVWETGFVLSVSVKMPCEE